MVNEATEWLKDKFSENMRVFEYGTSDSTFFFVNNGVKELITIEHDIVHYEEIEDLKLNYEKTKIYHILIEPVKEDLSVPYSHLSFGSKRDECLNFNFKKYVEYINRFPDKAFHIVFINGRSRASCISVAVSKVKNNGYLILNNSERFEYSNATDIFLKKYESRTFSQKDTNTTIWEII